MLKRWATLTTLSLVGAFSIAAYRLGGNDQTALQGKVVDRATGKPLPDLWIDVIGLPVHNDRSYRLAWNPHCITDKQGNFRILVTPGSYGLFLDDMAQMTPQMAHHEARRGTLTSQRTDWASLTGSVASVFHKGNAINVNVQRGQVKTYLFRYRLLRTQ